MLIRTIRVVNPNLTNQRGQNFAGLAEKRVIGERSQRRWIFVDLDHNRARVFRAAPQIGRGRDEVRSPDEKDPVAVFGSADCGFDRVDRQHFAKPNDVRPKMPAARSTSLLFEIKIFAAAIVLKAAKAMNVSV